ncbi:MAG: hypothetical protein BWY87_01483 [Deltaproteobacteria bacterium ADurb.Bin510]|nr:MAG: hypothetical protein BWY87_01483 [Deltaproteobacteria bacterium ADurb.Bin510]
MKKNIAGIMYVIICCCCACWAFIVGVGCSFWVIFWNRIMLSVYSTSSGRSGAAKFLTHKKLCPSNCTMYC